MKDGWTKVRFSDVLRRRALEVKVEPSESYDFAGVYSFGRGVFRRESRMGSQFSYPLLSKLRTGDFVYPKLMAWEGAFGVVPVTCNDCCVSPEFPVFEPRRDRISPELLSYYFRIPRIWEEISGGSTGTNIRRRRLNPSDFLSRSLLLPPLEEQLRIVARIDLLAADLQHAMNLRREADAETGVLLQRRVMEFRSSGSWQEQPLGEVCEVLDRFRKPINSHERNSRQGAVPYYGAGRQVGWIDNFLFDEELVLLAEDGGPFDWRCAYVIEGKSWVNNHAHVLRGTGVINKFLMWMLKSTDLQPYLSGSTRGKLPQGEMKAIPIPVPPIADQRRIVAELDALQTEVDTLKRLQSETAAELDALLPAILDRAFKGELD